MAPRRSWENLPADLVAKIARCLTCVADRVQAARTCRIWLEGVLMDPCPPQLPWLLRPYQTAAALPPGATRTMSFFYVLCNRTHRVAVPNHTGGARFFGAYPRGWLFLTYGQSCGHGLINLRTREGLDLPDEAIGWGGLASRHPIFIRVATLSAPPAAPLEGCVAAAIVTDLTPRHFFGPTRITLWRMGSRLGSCLFQFEAEDVIYHDGAFHFLSDEGDLLVCWPEFQDEAPLERLQVRQEIRSMQGYVLNNGARYLVESRGELLMVLRVQPPEEVTSQSGSTRVYCVLSNCRTHHDMDDPPHGARFFGSHGGSWLLLAYEQSYHHAAVNLGDGHVIRLPDRVVDDCGITHDLTMLAAALSAPPDHPYYTGACVMPGWSSPTDLEVEDITFSGENFFFLTRGEHMWVCHAPVDGDGQVQLIVFEHKGRDYGELAVHSRYLVPTRLGPLMVVRFNHDQLMSTSFKVFQVIVNPPQHNDHPNGEEDDEGEVEDEEDDQGAEDVEEDQGTEEVDSVWCPCSWAELDTLGGQMLFVGRGCSRSYEAAMYLGWKVGIYFLDDLCFYDEEIMFHDIDERQYPCSDNGKWFEGPPQRIQGMPPQDPSSHSPPAWLLP
ncbi:unnamed protein product [Urochloa decumbens]|uniref:KIB1-4 beta-propeller domain-containing protein n=1 Tax=Urochloa decumbens TaxID=240449 RepID=A0ABC9GKT0_9POAL